MVREEMLSTTKLPMAIDFLAGELKLNGVFHTAMAKLAHYFTPFQTFVIGEAENDRGRFDMILALEDPGPRGRSIGPTAPRRRASFSTSSSRCRATACATTAGWRPSPATRSSTRPGTIGSRWCGTRSGWSTSPT